MYRTVDTSIWSDPKIRRLSSEEKMLFFYLITNSHAHLAGIYYLPIALVCHETGMTEELTRKGIDTLSHTHLAVFDDATEVIWVKNMLRYQGRGAKITKSVSNQLLTLHNSCLINDFLEHYSDLKIPYRTPIATPSDKDKEQEKDKDNNICHPPNGTYHKSFEKWWSVYPKKVGKEQASNSWKRAIKRLVAAGLDRAKAIELLEVAATEFTASPKGQGKYCPHPTTWLNQGRYEDDRSTWGDGASSPEPDQPRSGYRVPAAGGSTLSPVRTY